jgi:DNA-binding MarR family transcriptional regulator
VSRYPDPTHQILEEIHASAHVSQRSLASSLGIALGLTNSLVRGLIQRGWVRATRVQRHRVKYLLTPAGIAEKARLSQAAFQNAVDRYRVARARVQETFGAVSASWNAGSPPAVDGRRKPVVFYGTGELAEIGFICLQETDLELVAVIDDHGRDRFFGVPVCTPAAAGEVLKAAGSDTRLLVMSLVRTEKIEDRVAALGWPADQVTWI